MSFLNLGSYSRSWFKFVSLAQTFESNCDLLKCVPCFPGVHSLYSLGNYWCYLPDPEQVALWWVYLTCLIPLQYRLIYFETLQYLCSLKPHNRLSVEVFVKTEFVSSENSIPATLATFKLHFGHLKNCSTFVCFERFLKYKVSFFVRPVHFGWTHLLHELQLIRCMCSFLTLRNARTN